MPNLYIIAGCNGAGKTTASFTIFPQMLQCREFVNADEIARGISPFQPETVAIAAGRIMLNRIEALINQGVDFAIETTLTTRSYLKMILKAKEMGYCVSLIFLWLNDVKLAIERVQARVKAGGHSVPEDVVRRRYIKGAHNFGFLFKKSVDFWAIFDNSINPYQVIAKGSAFGGEEIMKKVGNGLELAYKKLVEQKKITGDYLVFSKNGKILKVKATDL